MQIRTRIPYNLGDCKVGLSTGSSKTLLGAILTGFRQYIKHISNIYVFECAPDGALMKGQEENGLGCAE